MRTLLWTSGLLALVGLLRIPLEAGMATHMLVQFPLVILAGMVFAGMDLAHIGGAPGTPAVAPAVAQMAARVGAWNRLGMAGLAFVAAMMAVAMIPRLLDLALLDARVEAIKLASLFAAGFLLRRSWAKAGLVVQGFFLGNILPMTAVVGTLYHSSPVRLCNSYRLDEQWLVGTVLVVLAIVAGALWLVMAGLKMHRAEMALR